MLGQFKQIILIDGAAIVEGYSEPLTWVGSTLVIVGGMLYAYLKMREGKVPQKPATPVPAIVIGKT